MVDEFDKQYWESHWAAASDAHQHDSEPSPYLVETAKDLSPATALDAGCGTGTDAIWLAGQGWQVTGADISGRALSAARHRAELASVAGRTEWIEADLTAWEPESRWDLVVTSYAHPTGSQSAFYQRIGEWVEPGGTLLIVAHRHASGADSHAGSTPPDAATAGVAEIRAGFDPAHWRIEVAEEQVRSLSLDRVLHDAVVRAVRMG